jgi:hypothetical protein
VGPCKHNNEFSASTEAEEYHQQLGNSYLEELCSIKGVGYVFINGSGNIRKRRLEGKLRLIISASGHWNILLIEYGTKTLKPRQQIGTRPLQFQALAEYYYQCSVLCHSYNY